MSKLFKQFLFVAVLAFTVSFSFEANCLTIHAQTKTPLEPKQAVEIAEKFVVANGYTETSVNRTENLYLEEDENASDLKNILAARLGSIESNAVFAAVKEQDGETFWSIQFFFNESRPEYSTSAREVRVSLDGSKVWMNPKLVESPAHVGDCTGANEKP